MYSFFHCRSVIKNELGPDFWPAPSRVLVWMLNACQSPEANYTWTPSFHSLFPFPCARTLVEKLCFQLRRWF